MIVRNEELESVRTSEVVDSVNEDSLAGVVASDTEAMQALV
jgi:hypothetical protein